MLPFWVSGRYMIVERIRLFRNDRSFRVIFCVSDRSRRIFLRVPNFFSALGLRIFGSTSARAPSRQAGK